MPKEVFLDPVKFQDQIDMYDSGNEAVKSLRYDVDTMGLMLNAIDLYMECINEFNQALQAFGELTDQDVRSMRVIRGAWMGLDEDLATSKVLDRFFKR
jgi:hypothetical protein